MAESERLSGSVQESLLTALAYVGQEAAPILAVVVAEHFDGEVYQNIAASIIEYRTRFKEPPGSAHLDDLFDYILDDREHKHHRAYTRILVGMREQAPTLNVKYLVDRVVAFARGQRLKSGLIEANERYMLGGDTRDDETEAILQATLRSRIESVDYGERLSKAPLDFMSRDETEDGQQVKIGIDILDRLGIVPTRGELYYLLGNRGEGKSWWLQYLLRRASRQGWFGVHISLENKLRNVKRRYIQSWLSVAKRDEKYVLPMFNRDRDGRLDDISYEVMRPHLSFDKPSDASEIHRLVGRWRRNLDLIVVKEWPSRVLTIPLLERWLDGLEASEGITPDIIALDYPQLMKINPQNFREEYGILTQELRRIAGERNLAMCCVMQSNRLGEKAKILRADHTAEDISQVATADSLLTYNRTEQERRMGLARLFVAKARNDRDKFSILISQSYDVGQFHLDSVPMAGQEYWDMLGEVETAVRREDLGPGRDAAFYDTDDERETDVEC